MIDAEAMQDAIREANPVLRIEDLDAEELTRFVAVAHTRRAALMQAPTQERTSPQPHTPQDRRNRAWAFALAFVVALAGIGIAVLAVRGGDDAPVAGGTPTTITAMTVVEDPSAPGTWRPVAVGEPWVESIFDIEALPADGFIAVAEKPWAIRWSPDGVDWFDADPQRRVTPFAFASHEAQLQRRLITTTGDRVAIMDPVSIGTWLGDPRTGEWSFIEYDTSNLAEAPVLLTSAANDTEVLVITQETGPMLEIEPTEDTPEPFAMTARYGAWIIDTSTERSTRHVIPAAGAEWAKAPQVAAEWFKGEWMVLLSRNVWTGSAGGWDNRASLVMSADGTSWRTVPLGEETFNSVESFTAGSTSIIATVCNFGGDSFWYSVDGVEWTESTREHISHHSTYSEELGFVAGDLLVSRNGITWRSVGTVGNPDIGLIAASGANVLAIEPKWIRSPSEPASQLWLLTLDEADSDTGG